MGPLDGYPRAQAPMSTQRHYMDMKRWRAPDLTSLAAVFLSVALAAPAQATRRTGATNTNAQTAVSGPGSTIPNGASIKGPASAQAPTLITGVLTTINPIVIPGETTAKGPVAAFTPAARPSNDIVLPNSKITPKGPILGPDSKAVTEHNEKKLPHAEFVSDKKDGPLAAEAAQNEDLQLMLEGASGGGKTTNKGADARISNDATSVLAKLASIGALFDGGSTRKGMEANAAAPNPTVYNGRYHVGFRDGMQLNPADIEKGADHVGQWRLGDDAFKKQRSVEDLVEELELQPHHAQWLTDEIFTDRLTGLRNAIYLRENETEIVAANDNLITMKLDWLKEINDGVSHAAGDRFLELFGKIGNKIVGEEALLIRRSPTGFAAFVSGDEEKARLVAQALRIGIEQELGNDNKPIIKSLNEKAPMSTTISAGLARLALENQKASDIMPEDLTELGTLARARSKGLKNTASHEVYKRTYERAEEARMAAKDEAGGNTVAIHDEAKGIRFDESPTIQELEEAFAERDIQAWPAGDKEIGLPETEPDTVGDEIPGKTMREKVMWIAPNPELRDTINALMRKVYNNHLSGLHNRRWLDDNLEDVLGFFTEIHAIDIDHFGNVNKQVGEEEADRALGVLGKILHEQARGKPAIVLHLSGEEFFILTRMGPNRATKFAHKVRQHVGDNLGRRTNLRDKKTGDIVQPTISVGISPIVETNDLPNSEIRDKILEESEEALKKSKNMGRNWVSLFGSKSSWLDRAVGGLHALQKSVEPIPGIGRFASNAVKKVAKGVRRWGSTN